MEKEVTPAFALAAISASLEVRGKKEIVIAPFLRATISLAGNG
jgi:hypothetical protein